MRDAETVLAIIRERSGRGLPLTDVYRLLYNPSLYLYAYGRIYSNQGAMTRGVTRETADGMSLGKIAGIIDRMRREAYRWTPVRRVHIPKKRGGKRPLGIPTWGDKLVQEAVRLILEAHYEPRFSPSSHGLRPGHGPHTALREVGHWTGMKWFVEGDIKGCFDTIDHEVLLGILGESIHDNRFLRLIRHMLHAGYLEDWTYNATLSGTPQGGVVSPLLANVYMDRLDKYVEQTLIPAHTRGTVRKFGREYNRLSTRRYMARKKGDRDTARRLGKELRLLPTCDPYDPQFRRLRYVRYADDFLLGFVGPKTEAEEIKQQLGEFLFSTLKLTLSPEKTLVTHAATGAARFLGYDIAIQHRDDYCTDGRRSVNGRVALRLPVEVLDDYIRRWVVGGKPARNGAMTHESDFAIVAYYGAVLRGIYNYYSLAQNAAWLHRLRWAMRNSMLHTLADKHRTTTRKIARQLQAEVEVDGRKYTCFEVRVEREGKPSLRSHFGGFPIRRQIKALIRDIPRSTGPHLARNELMKRLLAQICELCGSRDHPEVHHIRKLADLKRKRGEPRPRWVVHMASRQRKTIVLCHSCHRSLHSGEPLPERRPGTGSAMEAAGPGRGVG